MWEFTRVSPVTVAGADLDLLWPTDDPELVASVPKVQGTWLLRGTDRILSLTPNGGYAMHTFATLNRPETGTVKVGKAGALVFTPAGTPTCTARYESTVTRNSSMDATLVPGSCARLGGTTDTWIRIN